MKSALKHCDRLLRLGQGKEAQVELNRLRAGKLPIAAVPELASLLRRSGDAFGATGLLYKTILTVPTPSETVWNQLQAEYGASLNAIGCNEQARRVLAKVKAESFPLAYLYRAFTHLSDWDYGGARPHLQKGLQAFQPQAGNQVSYWQLVVKVNLLAADIFERDHVASEEGIKELLSFTERKPELKLLRSAVYELIAQHSIELKFYTRARDFLLKAASELREFDGISKLFVKKWIAIVDLFLNGPTESTVNALVKVRLEAQSRRHWETLRSLDLHQAIVTRHREGFLRVVFGTPFPSYRRRILSDFPGTLSLPPVVYLSLVRGQEPSCYLDLASGTLTGREGQTGERSTQSILDPAGLETQILRILSADLYRPVTLSLLYNRLHPNANYQPGMGEIVKSMIKTTQALLDEEKVPLKIVTSKGFVSLHTTHGVGFLVKTLSDVRKAA